MIMLQIDHHQPPHLDAAPRPQEEEDADEEEDNDHNNNHQEYNDG